MLKFHKILCPIDFSQSSHNALLNACEMAAAYEAQLLLIHVVPPLQPIYGLAPYPQVVPYDPALYEKAAENNVQRDLCDLIEQSVAPSIDASALAKTGIPAPEILKAAKDEDIDLIVMATHGLTGWRHRVFGSVTEQVLREAPCLVLTVH